MTLEEQKLDGAGLLTGPVLPGMKQRYWFDTYAPVD